MPDALRESLRRRAQALSATRAFFDQRGLIEVQTPGIVRSPGVDAHLDAIAVQLHAPGSATATPDRYLATSPEYHMKRLLAEGSGGIYQLARSWRDGEVGRLHEPEFCLLEWYQPGLDEHALMDETEALLRAIAAALCVPTIRRGEREADVSLDGAPFQRISWAQAFSEHAGVELSSASDAHLGRTLRAAGVRGPRHCNREELEDLLLVHKVEPALGDGVPTFLTDYPESRAGLARMRRSTEDGSVTAARFELYGCGVELCNGYHELSDPQEQRRRIDEENARREALGKVPYPVDEALLDALDRGLPDCAGNALGLDRLLMLLLGARSLDEVIAFRIGD